MFTRRGIVGSAVENEGKEEEGCDDEEVANEGEEEEKGEQHGDYRGKEMGDEKKQK